MEQGRSGWGPLWISQVITVLHLDEGRRSSSSPGEVWPCLGRLLSPPPLWGYHPCHLAPPHIPFYRCHLEECLSQNDDRLYLYGFPSCWVERAVCTSLHSNQRAGGWVGMAGLAGPCPAPCGPREKHVLEMICAPSSATQGWVPSVRTAVYLTFLYVKS